jgi:23S rRNA (cytidine2498-2'-O)-methyltransferase
MERVLLLCRAGFEGELAAEAQARAAALGLPGFCRARAGEARAEWCPAPEADTDAGMAVERFAREVPLAELVFARQLLLAAPVRSGLSPEDRAGPLLETFVAAGLPVDGLVVETPDTDELKPLQALCRKFAPIFERALARAGLWRPGAAAHRAHLVFLSTAAAQPALAWLANASPWPGGIPRLRLPGGLASRSARKLEEALVTFLGPEERTARVREGMRAVDLGAAPGGWSQLLARRGLLVTAVDNGPLDPAALKSGLVEHQREDGFRYRPPGPVDWLVCDMVEQPGRVAHLVARWLAEGWCRECIFNLKLPMKRRQVEVERCRALITSALDGAGVPHRLAFKQLYHDREEVTGHLCRVGK